MGVGLTRIYNQPLQSARVFVNPIKRTMEKSEAGRYGLRVGESGKKVSLTVGKFAVNSLPYVYQEVAPTITEAMVIQGAKLLGKRELAYRIWKNSRFNPGRDLEGYMSKYGIMKTREMLEGALVFAEIAAHVYTSEKGNTIQGFTVEDRFVDKVWGNSGFQAGLYFSSATGKYILAFEGTNPALASTDGIRDLCQDIKQGPGIQTEQYELAINLAKQMKRLYGDKLILTGHSLGGGLATAAALVNDIPAFVVDPAGVHLDTIARHGADFSREKELVHGIRLYGEVLTTLVNTAPGAVPTRGNIITIPVPKFVDPLSGHSSALAAQYIKKLLGMPEPPEN